MIKKIVVLTSFIFGLAIQLNADSKNSEASIFNLMTNYVEFSSGGPFHRADEVVETWENQAVNQGAEFPLSFSVEPGTNFKAVMTGTGDADLYVKYGSPPTMNSYDCRPWLESSNESCSGTVPSGVDQAYIMIYGYDYGTSVFNLTVTYTENTGNPPPSGDEKVETWENQAVNHGAEFPLNFSVEPGTNFKAVMTGTGDADLYVRYGSPPTMNSYDCRPWLESSNESCSGNVPSGVDRAYIMIYGYAQGTSVVNLTVTYTENKGNPPPPPPPGDSDYLIDHTKVSTSNFSSSDIQAARNIKLYFEHASVGGNIDNSLNQLQASDYRFNRSNFDFDARGNPGNLEKIQLFYNNLTGGNPHPSYYDALMFKFCYIDSWGQGTNDMYELFEETKDVMESLEARYPNQVFVWWTMPLRTWGNADRYTYNTYVRNYCTANEKFLFDIADIESHDPNGNPYYYEGYETMWDNYSYDGGHLNSSGGARVAKALWHLALEISKR